MMLFLGFYYSSRKFKFEVDRKILIIKNIGLKEVKTQILSNNLNNEILDYASFKCKTDKTDHLSSVFLIKIYRFNWLVDQFYQVTFPKEDCFCYFEDICPPVGSTVLNTETGNIYKNWNKNGDY